MASSTSSVGSDGGDDYSSLASWFTAKDGETGTHTAQLRNEVHDVGTGFTMNNGSTSGDEYIVEPMSGAEHDGRHRDVSGTGASIDTSSGTTTVAVYVFNINDKIFTIRDVCVKNVSTTSTANAIQFVDNGCSGSISRCILKGATTVLTKSGTTVDIQDNVVYGSILYGIDCRGASGSIVGNTNYTAAGTYGTLPGAGMTPVANNISVGFSSEDYFDSDVSDTEHKSNVAADATAVTEWDGGGGGVNNVEVLETGDTPTGDYVAFVNLTAGSEDFHLVDLEHGTYDNVAIAGGAPSLGSGFDIDNVARHATTPEIGADDLAVGGGSIIPQIMHHRRSLTG